MAKTPDKARISLEVSSKVREQIASLVERSKSASATDAIRKAVALFDLFLDHVEAGGKVVFKNPDGTEENLRLL